MISLGIESTAHTFGIGIVDEEARVLANSKKSYSTEQGGIIPSRAAIHHAENCGIVLKEALSEAGISLDDVDIISFSQGPGIGHTLKIGAAFARALSVLAQKPLIGVNHCIAHLEIGRAVTGSKDPVMLYASGANTQVIAYQSGKYRVFGETLDIGVGNLLDTFARGIGLGFPGGPKIYELSLKGKNYVKLPYVVKGTDVSFGGILTNIRTKASSGSYSAEDLSFSLQETVFAMLVEVSERAMAHTQKEELLLAGGVACNKRLQEMCGIMCRERGARLYVPDSSLLVDNGAMIAWQGVVQFRAGQQTRLDGSEIKPYQRTDDVEVKWR